MNPYIEMLKSKFEDVCSSFYIAQIDDLFSSAGFQNLNKRCDTRRGEVEAYYELIDWENSNQVRKFLKVIENVLLQNSHYFGEERKEELRNLCKKCGLEVDSNGYTIYLTKQSTNENIKNIIFASNSYKPEIIISDSLTNQIEIVENEDFCLVYNQPIKSHGLLWVELVRWWKQLTEENSISNNKSAETLHSRLKESIQNNPVEMILFETYYTKIGLQLKEKLPALIPQVYLHYDPYTIRQLQKMNKSQRLKRQRMDFLLLLPRKVRVVIEIDGKQHYSDREGKASVTQYSEMVAEDRKLKLLGYEIYRFGGHELMQENAPSIIEEFFLKLFSKHEVCEDF